METGEDLVRFLDTGIAFFRQFRREVLKRPRPEEGSGEDVISSIDEQDELSMRLVQAKSLYELDPELKTSDLYMRQIWQPLQTCISHVKNQDLVRDLLQENASKLWVLCTQQPAVYKRCALCNRNNRNCEYRLINTEDSSLEKNIGTCCATTVRNLLLLSDVFFDANTVTFERLRVQVQKLTACKKIK